MRGKDVVNCWRYVEGRNKMFYLVLNTFYSLLYGVRYMVKNILRQREEPTAVTSWATLSDKQQGIFYMHHPPKRLPPTMAFVIPAMEHMKQKIAQWVHHEELIWWLILPWAGATSCSLVKDKDVVNCWSQHLNANTRIYQAYGVWGISQLFGKSILYSG